MGTVFRRQRQGAKSNWIGEYTDHSGRRIQRSTRTTDKKTALQIVAHWSTEAAKRSGGLIDPDKDRLLAQASRPISEHVQEWIASIAAAGRTTSYLRETEIKLYTLIDHTEWERITDIRPESLEQYLAHLRTLGRANRTVAFYAGVAKQFTRWLVRTKRIQSNPLDAVARPSTKSGKKVKRRMLLPAEWSWLKTAAGDRALLYETAIQTGLRANELRAIRPSDLSDHYIQVSADHTKDGLPAKQFITSDLAARLRSLTPFAKSQLFKMPNKYSMADMVRADLASARSQWESRSDKTDGDAESDFLLSTNHSGESFDFHSLRHTCGAWLAIQGVHPKTIQSVMRHKSITLTMDVYGHLFPGAEPEAVGKLAGFFS
jgi:integrase